MTSVLEADWWRTLWTNLPEGVLIAIIIVLGVLGVVASGWILWKLAQKSGRGLLIGLAIATTASTLVFGYWAFSLPERIGSRFDLTDQLVRANAALSAMLATIFLLSLLVPRILNSFERGKFTAFVAARHVRSKKSGFLTVISLLSIAGVAISSLALCCVVSIMGGFGADLKEKILDNNAHIRIESPDAGGFEYWREILDEVRLVPGVSAATPVAGGEVMASSSTNTAGMLLRGVDTETFDSAVDVPQHMEVGSFEYLDDPLELRMLPPDTPIGIGQSGEVYLKGPGPEDAELEDTDPTPNDVYPGVVLGRELARSLHAYVGDVLTLVSPMGDLGPMGIMPRTRKFRVAGIFYTGMYEYDASHAYVKLKKAQELLDLEHFITAVDIRVDKVEQVDRVTPKVQAAIERDDLKVRDWKEMNRNLFSALKLEKIATFVVLSIAILVASFCIICTLLLMVTEKSREIAIMKAMGATDRSVLRLFMTEGMLIGGIGTVFGVVTGYILMRSLKQFGVRLDPEVYYIERLPVNVAESDYLLIALCAFVITTLATLYPARAASRLRPVDGIRYE